MTQRQCEACSSTGFRVRLDQDNRRTAFTCRGCGETTYVRDEDEAPPVATASKPVVAPAPLKLSVSAEDAPINVLRLARARLRHVNAELKRMSKLQSERDELKRIIDAATRKPAAVRSLRNAV